MLHTTPHRSVAINMDQPGCAKLVLQLIVFPHGRVSDFLLGSPFGVLLLLHILASLCLGLRLGRHSQSRVREQVLRVDPSAVKHNDLSEPRYLAT